MELTPFTFLVVCPCLFVAGIVDAIGGGGGLISLPAYLFAGLPPHTAIATNKLSSSCGTAVATTYILKNTRVDYRLSAPAVLLAICGSTIGSRLSLNANEKILLYAMALILPICAFVVLNKKLFKDRAEDAPTTARTFIIMSIASFAIGMYDGFYGPGTGAFLLVAFTAFAGLGIKSASAHTKIINLTANLTALTTFLLHRQVIIPLGLAAAAFNMAGGYIGARLMIRNTARIVRPTIIIVLAILLAKTILEELKIF